MISSFFFFFFKIPHPIPITPEYNLWRTSINIRHHKTNLTQTTFHPSNFPTLNDNQLNHQTNQTIQIKKKHSLQPTANHHVFSHFHAHLKTTSPKPTSKVFLHNHQSNITIPTLNFPRMITLKSQRDCTHNHQNSLSSPLPMACPFSGSRGYNYHK